MKFLLDENLHPHTATVMSALGAPDGDSFGYLTSVAPAATKDEDIPPVCARESFDALITVNHKDFGAKKLLYQSLMDVGVHVIVVRPGKMVFRVPAQVSVLSLHYPTFRRYVSEGVTLMQTTLIRVTPTTCDKRTLNELIAEIQEGQVRRPLP